MLPFSNEYKGFSGTSLGDEKDEVEVPRHLPSFGS